MQRGFNSGESCDLFYMDFRLDQCFSTFSDSRPPLLDRDTPGKMPALGFRSILGSGKIQEQFSCCKELGSQQIRLVLMLGMRI